MFDIAMTAIGDSGLDLSKNSVCLNDLKAIKDTIETYSNLKVKIYDRKRMYEIEDDQPKVLFIHYLSMINFGGQQSKWALKAIDLVNHFDGEVIIFSNDVIDGVNNSEREGFERITRPVYYADPNGFHDPQKTKDLNIIEEFEINQSFPIGRQLAQKEILTTKPEYKAVYGGRVRPSLVKYLKEISEHFPIICFGNVVKKLPEAYVLQSKYNFNNDELRVVNSLGENSFVFSEKKKNYFTSRVFEQMASNSLCLLEKSFKPLGSLFETWNVFSSGADLMDMVARDYDPDLIKKQHEALKSFDFASYEKKYVDSFKSILGD